MVTEEHSESTPASPSTPDAEAALQATPYPMRYPNFGAGAKALWSARRQLVEAEAAEFYAYAKQCAACVATAVLEDIGSGVLPKPDHNPKRIEDELYARAMLQARKSEYNRYFGTSPLTILLLADTVPSYSSGIHVTKQNYSEAMHLSLNGARREGPMSSAVLLHGNAMHRCSEVGLGVTVDWREVGLLVLRNLILGALWTDENMRDRLKLNLTSWEKDRRSPIWVGTPPELERDATQGRRRRKRL